VSFSIVPKRFIWQRLRTFASTCVLQLINGSSFFALCHFSSIWWTSPVAEPIGLRQCLRIAPKKHLPRSATTQQRSGFISKKTLLSKHVQLAFAWHANISIIAATGTAKLFLLVIFIKELFLMEIISHQNVHFGCSD